MLVYFVWLTVAVVVIALAVYWAVSSRYHSSKYSRSTPFLKQLHHANLPVGGERTRIANQQAELLKWFGHEFDNIQALFAKKLSLDQI